MTTAYTRRRHREASLASIRVADAMHRGVVTCTSDATLGTIARLLAAHRIHAVVVLPHEGADDWGIVSDLDLVAALSRGSLTATAGQISSTPTVSVRAEDPLTHALQLMRDHDAHHVMVLGRESQRPIGIVSTLDIADAVADLPQQGS